MQAIPDRSSTSPFVAGIGWRVQVVPFQCSANGTLFESSTVAPTAVQKLREVHDTPFSVLPAGPVGIRWIDQIEPFQRSARTPKKPMGPPKYGPLPTAMQALAEVHETLLRKL